ncbi:hypothetical protein SCLCIDRAFT_1225057 [Scleroderma citrinum Foug A]|uniref:Uncharacterized protein n=1 Tax=Scleroderma citrinum Foug A TaxID=1036808 RepID=A0A0C3D439_9AGAM|nr:hypothetical protein SCLCIDRAFT_1225057 [Scleroderma citrinum Foug A]
MDINRRSIKYLDFGMQPSPQPGESSELQHWIRPCRTSREWQMRPVRTHKCTSRSIAHR